MNTPPRLLDLFSGAGGAAKGYQRAGFYVVGVDIKPQPRYCGDQFVQADALDFCASFGTGFDAIHASPPCERYSQLTPITHRDSHMNLIGPVRQLLWSLAKPFIIENVPGAKRLLHQPLMLCGSQWSLRVRRHRFFELGRFAISELIAPCDHGTAPVLISGTHRRTYEPRYEYSKKESAHAADIDWMTRAELDKAIPPAYTEYLGRQLLAHLTSS